MGRRDHDRYDIPPQTSGKAIISLVLGLLSFGCTFLTGLPAIILGILSIRDANRSDGQITGKGLAVAGIVTGVLGTLVGGCILGVIGLGIAAAGPAMQKVQEAAARMESTNNVKQLGIAAHAYHDLNFTLPPQAIAGKDGKPLLSWRVAILPQLNYGGLYSQFKLDEPWDSANNKPLLSQMPPVYFNSKAPPTETGYTYYQAFSGPGTAFEPGKKIRLTEISDGTSNTIFFTEGAKAVPWTKPEDIPFLPNGGMPALADFYGGKGSVVVFGDGSARFVPKSTKPEMWKSLITRSGGEVLDPNLDF